MSAAGGFANDGKFRYVKLNYELNIMRDKISACLTVGNEENNIRRCLESLKWVDEIVVVDSFSKDRTVDICKEYTDRVYQHEWRGYVGQKEL
ncbi:MAG: hypothetical protein COX20_13895, partial [Desulfobacterales bacterium CG23_combo_of_CG06-09_8_20_14_all_52_9]